MGISMLVSNEYYCYSCIITSGGESFVAKFATVFVYTYRAKQQHLTVAGESM